MVIFRDTLQELVPLLLEYSTDVFTQILQLKSPTYSNYYPGSVNASDITAFVIDDPDAVFLIDADEAFTRADLFANYSVTNATGTTITGISQVQLDVSAVGTDTTFVVQAIDIAQDANNSDTSVANANVLVRINNHFTKLVLLVSQLNKLIGEKYGYNTITTS
jgi:hypothetical protein